MSTKPASDLEIANGSYLQYLETGDECYIANLHPDEMRAFIRDLGDYDRAKNESAKANDIDRRVPTQAEWDTKRSSRSTCEWCGGRITIYMSRLDWRNRYDTYIKHDDLVTRDALTQSPTFKSHDEKGVTQNEP
jgi:hypothetical protein